MLNYNDKIEKKQANFTAINNAFIYNELFISLSGNAIKVLLILLLHSNFYLKKCFPSIDRLVTKSGLTNKTVIKVLYELANKKIIFIEKSKKYNTYNFNYDILGISKKENDLKDIGVNYTCEKSKIKTNEKAKKLEQKKDKQKIGSKSQVKILHSNKNNINLEQQQEQKNKCVVVLNDLNKSVFEKLKRYNLNESTIYNLLKLDYNDYDKLFKYIENNKHKIVNISGFVVTAIKQNWNFDNITSILSVNEKTLEQAKKQKELHKLKECQKEKQINSLNDIYNNLSNEKKIEIESLIDKEIIKNYGYDRLNYKLFRISMRIKIMDKIYYCNENNSINT